jgi:hypothetical protein
VNSTADCEADAILCATLDRLRRPWPGSECVGDVGDAIEMLLTLGILLNAYAYIYTIVKYLHHLISA